MTGSMTKPTVFLLKALAYSGAVRDSYTQTFALLGLGQSLGALGQLEAAERTILQSQFLAAQLQLPDKQLEGAIALAEFALQRGSVSDAIHNYQEALLLVSDQESVEYARLQRLEAHIAFAQGKGAGALGLLAEAEALFTSLQIMPEVRRTAWLRRLFADVDNKVARED